jgi:hypothetical protein
MPRILDVVVHLCLRAFQYCLGRGSPVTFPPHLGIMVTYSDGDVDVAIQSLLVQFYPILLSTLLSINRQQLSIFDADFALLVTSSPLAIYLSFASVCDLCGIRTGLFKRIKSYRNIVRALGAFVPFLWTALSMVRKFLQQGFSGQPVLPTSTFREWLGDTLFSLLSIGRGSFLWDWIYSIPFPYSAISEAVSGVGGCPTLLGRSIEIAFTVHVGEVRMVRSYPYRSQIGQT